MKTENAVRPLIVIAFTVLLAACGKPDTPASPPTVAAPGQVASEATPAAALWIEPLSGCGEQQVSTVHWESALFASGPIEIFVGEDTDAALFAEAGGPGMKETGPWLMPGEVVVARTTDGTEVGRAVAAGPGCAG